MASSSSPFTPERHRAPALQYRHCSAEAVLVRHDAGAADAAAGTPVARTTTTAGFSVTKTLTAAAVLQLADDGHIDLAAPPHRYITGLPYPPVMTIAQLLSHTGGLPNPLPLRWTHDIAEQATFDADAFFRRIFARHPRLVAAPGRRVVYSNLGYQLLGMVIEAVAGTTYAACITDQLLPRFGLAPGALGFRIDPMVHARGHHRRWTPSRALLALLLDREAAFTVPAGSWDRFRFCYVNGAAYGGIIGTADGFAAYLQGLLRGTALSPGVTTQLLTECRLSDGRPAGIGAGWFSGKLRGEAFWHHAGGGGGYYAELRLYPATGRASVLLLNRTGLRDERRLDVLDPLVLPPAARTA